MCVFAVSEHSHGFALPYMHYRKHWLNHVLHTCVHFCVLACEPCDFIFLNRKVLSIQRFLTWLKATRPSTFIQTVELCSGWLNGPGIGRFAACRRGRQWDCDTSVLLKTQRETEKRRGSMGILKEKIREWAVFGKEL